jgi:hypothetical protein
MIRRLATLATAIVVPAMLLLAGNGAASAAVTARPAPCSGVLAITAFGFHPPQVLLGQGSTATVSAVNCTSQSQQASVTWFGHYVNPAGGTLPPPGCPVIDPILFQATFAPRGSYTGSVGYTALSFCTAPQLQVTVQFRAPSGTLLAQATATLTIIQPAAG